MSKSNPLSRRAKFHARAGLGAAIAVAAMLFLTPAAQAHSSTPHPFKSASIQWDPGGPGHPSAPALFVGHDGNTYTHLVGEISTRFRLKASVKSGYRIYGFGITTGDPDMADNIPGDLIGFHDGTYEKSLDKHATFTMDADTAVTSGTPGIHVNRIQEVVDMCNSAFDTPPPTDQGAGQIQLTVHGVFSRGVWTGTKFVSWTAWYPDDAESRPAYAHTIFPVNVVCLNKNNFRVGQFQPKPKIGFDHGKMLIKEAKLFLTTIITGQNTGVTLGGCKTLKTTVRFETNQTGPVSFDLHRFPGGMTKHTAQAKFEPDTGKYYARYQKYETFQTTTSVQYMAMSTSPSAGNTGWKGITIHCGGGLTQNPNPNNNPDDLPPQGQTLKGDFAFVDHGSPKCARAGKALISFRSPNADNIHYSLDCKFASHSGVMPVNPHPDGGYVGAALVSFPITETIDESCTLRTVAPYAPKNHVSKGHLFQCVTPAFPPATTDLAPETRPELQAPRNPGGLAAVPPRDPRVAVDPVKPDRGGERTDSAPDYGKKTRHDAGADKKRLEALKRKQALEARKKAAERKRREAAKKAAEARRKRETAKKAAELKHRREAAKKAAEARRKRAAAKKAAEARRKREAAKKAAQAARKRKRKAAPRRSLKTAPIQRLRRR